MIAVSRMCQTFPGLDPLAALALPRNRWLILVAAYEAAGRDAARQREEIEQRQRAARSGSSPRPRTRRR